jgi:hypothetical protein
MRINREGNNTDPMAFHRRLVLSGGGWLHDPAYGRPKAGAPREHEPPPAPTHTHTMRTMHHPVRLAAGARGY